MERAALANLIEQNPELRESFETASRLPRETGGVEAASFLPGAGGAAGLRGPSDLRTRLQRTAQAIGGEWTSESLRNFITGASGMAVRLAEATVGQGPLSRDADSLIADAQRGRSGGKTRELFFDILDKIPGLSYEEKQSLASNPDITRNLNLNNPEGLKSAVQAVQAIASGNAAMSEDTINGIYSQLFQSPSAEAVGRLEERYRNDPSMRGLISRVRDVSTGATREGVGNLLYETLADPKQRTARLGALAGAGLGDLGGVASSSAATLTNLERLGRRGGAGGRQAAVIGLLSNVMDVTALRARGTSAEDVARAAQGAGLDVGDVQQYIQSGKWGEGQGGQERMVRGVSGVFQQVMEGAAQGRNEATKAQEELPEKIGQAMKKAMEGMTWDITITGALTQGENPVDSKSDGSTPGGTGSGASGSLRVQSGQQGAQ